MCPGLSQRCPCFRPGDAVDNQRVRRLELSEGFLCLSAEYAVHRPGVKSEIRDGALQTLDRLALEQLSRPVD